MITEAFRKLTLSAEFYLDVKDILPDLELTQRQKHTLALIEKFFAKYERMPTREELLLFFDELPEGEKKFLVEYKTLVNEIYGNQDAVNVDSKVIITELKEKVAKRRIKDKLVGIADKFDTTDSKNIMATLQTLMFENTELVKERRVEIDVADTSKNISIVRYKDTERIPTTINSLDHALYGGVGVREFLCFIAPPGRGKTTALINLFYGFLAQGYNALYISLEMSVVDILRRLYRRVLYKNKDFLKEDNDGTVKEWLDKFFGMSKAQGRVLYFPANTLSTERIKTELMKMEIQGKFMPQVIIIDHLDLMISETKSIRQKEAYAYWRLIVDDLREIPLTRGIPIITATQSTRDSAKKKVVAETDVGESFGKVQSSDVVISINQMPEELENKRMRFCVVKNRDYYKGAVIEIYSDLDMMLLCDLIYAQRNSWL